MKNLTCLISGAPEGENLRDLQIEPGTTAGDVLNALNLRGYLLSRAESAQAFANEENIYAAIQDGDKLRATPVAEVGQDSFVAVFLFMSFVVTAGLALLLGLVGAVSHISKRRAERERRLYQQQLRKKKVVPSGARQVRVNTVAGRNSRGTLVARDSRPLWELRGWRREGEKLVGAYRTPRGAFLGEIVLNGRKPEFFIINPPAALVRGPHSACFRKRGDRKYFIHFGVATTDIDGGIVGVEKLVAQSI